MEDSTIRATDREVNLTSSTSAGRVSSGRSPDPQAGMARLLDGLWDALLVVDLVRGPDAAVVGLVVAGVNEAALAFLGRPREEVLGARIGDWFPLAEVVALASFHATVTAGTPLVVDDWPLPGRAGTRWFDLRAVSVDGRIALTWREATGRHEAASRASSAEALFRLVAENSPDMILQVDSGGVIQWASPATAEVLGFRPEELVGTHSMDLVHPRDAAHARQAIAVAEAQGSVRDVRVRMRQLHGAWRWVEVSTHQVPAREGQGASRVARFRDVTQEVHARAALEEAEQGYRLVAENAADFVLTASPSGMCSWVSPGVTAVVGWQPADLVGRSIRDLSATDTWGPVLAGLAAGPVGASARGRIQLRCRDGSARWLGYLLRRVAGGDGQGGAGLVGSCWDVQSRVEAEAAVHHEQVQTIAVLDSLLDPVVLCTCDADPDDPGAWRIVRVNAAARAALAPGRDVPVGSTLAEVAPAGAGPLFAKLCHRVLASGQPVSVDDLRAGTPGGSADHWFDARAVATSGGVSLTWRVVTDRHDAARRLAESEFRFRLIAENAADVVARADVHGVIEWVSESVTRVLGWAPQDLVGRPIFALLHPDDLPPVRVAQPAVRGGQVVNLEARVRTATGGYRWMHSQVRPLVDESGAIIGRVAGWRDIQAEREVRERLERSEANYRMLAENASDLVGRGDLEGVVEWISPSVRALGWDPDDLVGRTMADMLHPDDVAVIGQVSQAVAAGEHPSVQVRIRERDTRDGQVVYHWFRSAVRPITDEDGHVVGRIAGLQLIDAERAALEAAEAGEARLRALIDTVGSGITVHGADGTIVACNPAAEQIFGLSHDEVVGGRMMNPRWQVVHDDGTPFTRGEHPVVQTLATQRPQNGVVLGLRRPGGATTWITVNTSPITAPDLPGGRGVVASQTDITALHDSQVALAESETRFRLLAENAADTVFRIAGDGTLSWISPSVSETLGWTADELLGRPAADLLHPEDLPVARAAVAQARGSAPIGFECRVPGRDGQLHWLGVTLRIVRDGRGGITERVGSCRDITDGRAAREELRFLATHDPLTRLANRRNVLDVLATLLGHPGRTGTVTGVIFADLDHLKVINDTYGHAAGDAAIATVAARIVPALRESDMAARIGGDEFLVVLPGLRGLADAQAVAATLHEALAPPMPWEGQGIGLSLSLGATVAACGEDPDAVVARADAAAYRAKRSREV